MARSRAHVAAVTLALVIAFAASGRAATAADPPVPGVIRFAGSVAPASGTVTVVFSLYAGQSDEMPLWHEVQTLVVDGGGRYSVALGAATPGGLPAELFARGEARWLGARVEGQPEQPRAMLVSVPYAFKAGDAETVAGRPLSAFVLAGNTTGVGPDGLTYVDTRVLKSGLAAAAPSPQAATTGTQNYLARFMADGVSLGDSTVFQAGARVGVGTTTPAATLHVVSTEPPLTAPALFFDVVNNSLGALPAIYRAARGVPGALSAVGTDDILGGLAVRGYATTKYSDGAGQVMFRAAQNWTDTAQGTYLLFSTTALGTVGWVERLRVEPGGNIGIGTSTPAQKLTVNGAVWSMAGGFRFPDGTTQTTALSRDANTFTATQTISSGNLELPATGGATTGVLKIGGQSFLHAYGDPTNTFAGGQAGGGFTTSGGSNTGVGYQALYTNSTGDSNTAVGYGSLLQTSVGAGNTAIGTQAGALVVTGSNNTFVGYHAATDGYNSGIVNATAIGANALVTQNNSLVLGGTGANAVSVGIGTSAPNTTLQVVGDIRVGTSGTNGCLMNYAGAGMLGLCSSDARLKTNVNPFAPVLDRLVRLQPVHFNWKVKEFPEYHFGEALNSGLIAQDVERVFPEMVATDVRGYKMVNYSELPYLTLAGVRELKAENDALKARLERLEAIVAQLQKQK
ncbi:MAG TPA: tail fiber domain-containing protein [Vicinamibacterales bacterium]|jgi:hypothetical protein